MTSLLKRKRVQNQSFSALPYGIRLFAVVRAIRWFGWGLGEALLPVFILQFSHTFAEAGLFSSTVEIVSLMSLPIIGVWADRWAAKRLVLWSLVLYPLVGLSYLCAGIIGAAVFVVIARVINGFTWELENVGVATYYRRVTVRHRVATSFGYLDTISNASWIAAALIGMFLVTFTPIHYLLFGIAPFSLLAFLVALKSPKDATGTGSSESSRSESWIRAVVDWHTWTEHLWLLAAIVFFASIISSLTTFFIPIAAYLAGANLPTVVLIGIMGAIPSIFGYKLGRLADRHNQYVLLALALVTTSVVTVWLGTTSSDIVKLGAVLFLGIIIELFSVVQCSLVTALGPEERYGRRGSAFESISTLGDLSAPVVLGAAFDLVGFAKVCAVVAGVAVILAVVFYLKRNKHPLAIH